MTHNGGYDWGTPQQPTPPSPWHAAQEQPTAKRSTPTWLIVVGVIVVLAVAGGVAAWFFLTNPGSSSSSSTIPNTVVVDQDGNVITESDPDPEPASPTTDSPAPLTSPEDPAPAEQPVARPAVADLPPAAMPLNAAAFNNEPAGNLNNVYKSGPTSDQFALDVRDAYVRAYLGGDPQDYNHVVQVYSNATGLTYSMSCVDKGSYVHCTGGNDANVYIA